MIAPPGVPQPEGPFSRLERWLVVLIALHSGAIGIGAVVAPEWGLRFGGFGEASPLFFPRQVGIFHLVVANAYLLEYFRYRGVSILLATKMVAVLFLGGMLLIYELPWIVPFSALGDGAMGLALTWVHLRRRREERDSR